MYIKFQPSPNFDIKKRPKNSVKMIVIHYTGMQSERVSLKKLLDPKSKVSCHYFIGRNGTVTKLVNEIYTAWHAGKSCWKKLKYLNQFSIGIEIVNKGHEWNYQNFKKEQIKSLIKLCKILIKKFNIKKINIVGHSDIAPQRKMDPGEKFPWEELSRNKIGLWHDLNIKRLKLLRNDRVSKKDIFKMVGLLKKIGYCINLNDKKSKKTKVFIAFQRHYRQGLINGILDKECIEIAENLKKKHQK